MAQLTCSKLALGYEGHVVLKGLDFSVNAGDYLCIVGENGSGKSTLMKTILGLIKPVDGKITWGEGLRENEIGYLPQQTVVQKDFPATVREIVLSGCQGRAGRRPFYSRADKELARENMERMRILPFARRCYRELSGGQQQRVLLARALSRYAPVVPKKISLPTCRIWAFHCGTGHFCGKGQDQCETAVPEYFPHGRKRNNRPDYLRFLRACPCLRGLVRNAERDALVYVPDPVPGDDPFCRHCGRNRLAGPSAAGTGEKAAFPFFSPADRRGVVLMAFLPVD